MTWVEIFFYCIECFAFVLPALPSSLAVRLSILVAYFLAHAYKLQYAYDRAKRSFIRNYGKVREHFPVEMETSIKPGKKLN